ncbi:MAG: GNAT family N-acetyltransferase [Paracoccus sp. (in: a-proteobacteria)]|uniref:GNAT family N-acetyltransferase n=1 Tax=Paracoccus sp. TaxID=267 RepID=UPI0026E0E6DE|nr:GNAT family N-acetyltransferase [Paracoccus sp. (in: a-proteobacteria)]MDO5613511.1 GNAT family N-acetyltransferase [Paracoccus sp. (in: a-proteobacteria)]
MIRWAGPQDAEALGRVMFDAIHRGRSPYSPAQQNAWLPAPNSGRAWAGRLARQRVAMAEQDGNAIGFMTLAEDGCIDLAYLLPEYRGHGLFRQLYERLEQDARQRGLDSLYTHASLMAEGPFMAAGFVTEQAEHVARGDQVLARFLMRKWLI